MSSSDNSKMVKVAATAMASIAVAAAIGLYRRYSRSRKEMQGATATSLVTETVSSVKHQPPSKQQDARSLKAQDVSSKKIEVETKATAGQVSPEGVSYKILGEFEHLFHMTHINNLESILSEGLLAKAILKENRLLKEDISDPLVQNRRDRAEPVHKRSIHDYVPFYLCPRNPMLSKKREIQDKVIILGVSAKALMSLSHLFADGNAASCSTEFSQNETVLVGSLDVLRAKYWLDFEDGKRRKCAEVLVHSRVDPAFIDLIICNDRNTLAQVNALTGIRAVVDKSYYF